MQAKVEICGVNTSELPVYSSAQTDALLRRAAAGDRGARDELIRGNLRLVLSVVQRFRDRGESPDDLFQVGCIGLMKSMNVPCGNPPIHHKRTAKTIYKGENYAILQY